MANQNVSVHAGIYGMGIYAIMLPSSWFSVAHYFTSVDSIESLEYKNMYVCIINVYVPHEVKYQRA